MKKKSLHAALSFRVSCCRFLRCRSCRGIFLRRWRRPFLLRSRRRLLYCAAAFVLPLREFRLQRVLRRVLVGVALRRDLGVDVRLQLDVQLLEFFEIEPPIPVLS